MDTWRNGRWTARKCKTSPQELLPEYDAWLWMDNQLFFTYDPRSLFDFYLNQADLSAHHHCDRNCAYEETQAALGRRPERDKPETLINQAEQYKSEGYPSGNGLYENGILFRRNNEHTNNFNKLSDMALGGLIGSVVGNKISNNHGAGTIGAVFGSLIAAGNTQQYITQNCSEYTYYSNKTVQQFSHYNIKVRTKRRVLNIKSNEHYNVHDVIYFN